MTLIVENVKEEFLSAFIEVAKNANARIIQQDSQKSDKDIDSSFEALRKEMLEDLKTPQNYAVFERLKDK
ncbi:hypothetical protein [Helicobacter macacae]|uniref:Uncharacterized protein n=1 Tax=Helicobacter macacae MIT 99-5501 TaxID=1357400 RepID=V8CCC5_9HELI|nr:hypothetical protein [Helicobacter macacae]ETD24675.1 hypothetical protein HMPREF2086_00007 [Helicobacter macacae MIT 99-5501]